MSTLLLPAAKAGAAYLGSVESAESYVKITGTPQNPTLVEDLFGVSAQYVQGVDNSVTGPFSSAAYVQKFYQALFGLDVTNLQKGQVPVSGSGSYLFEEIDSGFRRGDIAYQLDKENNGHWMIVRTANENVLRVVEQDWKWLEGTDTYAGRGRIAVYGKTKGLRVFRLCLNTSTTITKVRAFSGGSIAMSFSKYAPGNGYEIQYGKKADFSDARIVWNYSQNKVDVAVKNLEKGGTYYLGVRPYIKVEGLKFYGRWSVAARITCPVITKLDKSEASLNVGSQLSLTATVVGPTSQVMWSTDNRQVAEVSQNGTVKGIGEGTCYIYAKANGKAAKCRITVSRVINGANQAYRAILEQDTISWTSYYGAGAYTSTPGENGIVYVNVPSSNFSFQTADLDGDGTSELLVYPDDLQGIRITGYPRGEVWCYRNGKAVRTQEFISTLSNGDDIIAYYPSTHMLYTSGAMKAIFFEQYTQYNNGYKGFSFEKSTAGEGAFPREPGSVYYYYTAAGSKEKEEITREQFNSLYSTYIANAAKITLVNDDGSLAKERHRNTAANREAYLPY